MAQDYIRISPMAAVVQKDSGCTHHTDLPSTDCHFMSYQAGKIKLDTVFDEDNLIYSTRYLTLLSGEINLHFRHIEDVLEENIVIAAPVNIEIQPLIRIALAATTDVILLASTNQHASMNFSKNNVITNRNEHVPHDITV